MKENNVIKIKPLAENMLKLYEKNESIYEKISSGYNDLDLFIDSLKKSKLTVIAGRPSSGKSSLIYNLMYNISKQNKKILCFSLDTDIKYVLNSLTAIDSKIPIEKIDSLHFSSDEWEKYTKSIDIVTEFPIVFYNRSRATYKTIENIYNELEEKPNVIFIDHLQLLSPVNTYIIQNREQEISSIVRDLKLLANELDVNIIVTSQLSRAVEDRADKRPMLKDLRDSGAIEDSADLVLFLYNDSYYNNGLDDLNSTVDNIPIVEVIVAKNKRGNVGTIKLGLQKEINRFVNIRFIEQ